MAHEIPGQMLGILEVNADFKTSQYTGVVVNSDGTAGLPPAGAIIIGVIQNDPRLGNAATIMVSGTTRVQVGTAFNPGQILAVTSTGQFAPATSGQFGCAIAIDQGTPGTYATAQLLPCGKQ